MVSTICSVVIAKWHPASLNIMKGSCNCGDLEPKCGFLASPPFLDRTGAMFKGDFDTPGG